MLNLPLILLLAAAVCFVVALLVALSAVTGNYDAWLVGGLLAWALSLLVAPLAARPQP